MNESDIETAKELSAEEILARVLHRDGLMLVIDKPAGLPVHRGPKGGPNLEASFDALRFGLPRPPVLAHRLDRDTSGCLVLGRHRKATATLGLLFKHSKIAKTYWAVVEGGPDEDHGTIDLPIGKRNAERGWWQKIDHEEGLPSLTKWTVLGRSQPITRAAETAEGSPPPCGQGSGVGVDKESLASGHPPPPPPPPPGGGGAGGGGGGRQGKPRLWTPPTPPLPRKGGGSARHPWQRLRRNGGRVRPNSGRECGGERAADLAGAGADHRPHPSIAGALRGDGLADRRRQHLWQRPAVRRTDAASARPADFDSAIAQQAAGGGDRAGAAASAPAHACLRLERRVVSSAATTNEVVTIGRPLTLTLAFHN